jgi:hypothetical protein
MRAFRKIQMHVTLNARVALPGTLRVSSPSGGATVVGRDRIGLR